MTRHDDQWLERALRAAEPHLADDGFTQRVLAALPPAPAPRATRLVQRREAGADVLKARGLLGSTLSLETSGRKLFAIPGSIPSATQMPAGCRFAPRSTLVAAGMP